MLDEETNIIWPDVKFLNISFYIYANLSNLDKFMKGFNYQNNVKELIFDDYESLEVLDYSRLSNYFPNITKISVKARNESKNLNLDFTNYQNLKKLKINYELNDYITEFISMKLPENLTHLETDFNDKYEGFIKRKICIENIPKNLQHFECKIDNDGNDPPYANIYVKDNNRLDYLKYLCFHNVQIELFVDNIDKLKLYDIHSGNMSYYKNINKLTTYDTQIHNTENTFIEKHIKRK